MKGTRKEKIQALRALMAGNPEPFRFLADDPPLIVIFTERNGKIYTQPLSIDYDEENRPIEQQFTKEEFTALQERYKGRTVFLVEKEGT